MHSRPLKAVAEAPLVGDDELERLRILALQRRGRRRATGARTSGARPSGARGHGMELHDTRPYQPGDDVRHLDWRATARSGRPVTKVFVEERAPAVAILVDRRPTMHFGTRRELKAATAARIAALLAFQANADHATVSGVVLGHEARSFAPAGNLAGTRPFLAAATAPLAPEDTVTRAANPAVAARALPCSRGSVVYLLSDFNDVITGAASLADYLPPRTGTAVTAVRIVDAAEIRMIDAGRLRLMAPQDGGTLVVDTGDATLRRRYAEEVARRAAALASECALLGVALHTVTNGEDLAPQIEPLL